jgi:hypothetical protein
VVQSSRFRVSNTYECSASCVPGRVGLTLPSSGPPPAWPASLLLSMFRCAGQAGGGPLMSNVRQHRNMCALPAPHRAASGKFRCDRAVAAKFKRVRALGALALNLSRKSKHCATGSLNTYKSLGLLFAVGCPRKPARAARHSAGCSPTAVRVRSGCVRVSPCSLPLRQAGAKLDERDRCVFSDLP